MAEAWFSLSKQDKTEALELASDRSGRPAHLIEKDIWVVWALGAIYDSSVANKLTFKGGTSLSKVYRIIDRFSEDIDLTYDIRELVPDLLREGNPIPPTASQEKKISSEVRKRLPGWIQSALAPILQRALLDSGLEASLIIEGKEREKLVIRYPALKSGTGYVPATILLEFGARATGEPNQIHEVRCDIEAEITDVVFPIARPLVMAAERTFWEKATAAHVYCLQGRLRSDRFSRHWYDLAAIAKTAHFESAINNKTLSQQVAEHKAMFFAEKDGNGNRIDYLCAVQGQIQLIPEGESLRELGRDYAAMLEDGLLSKHQPTFAELIDRCRIIESRVNQA